MSRGARACAWSRSWCEVLAGQMRSGVGGLGDRATPEGEGTSLMWRERVVVRFSFAAREYPHGSGVQKYDGNIQTTTTKKIRINSKTQLYGNETLPRVSGNNSKNTHLCNACVKPI